MSCGRIPLLAFCALSFLAGCGEVPTASDLQQTSLGPTYQDGVVRIPQESLPFLEIATVNGSATYTAVRAPGQIVFRDGAVAEIGAPIAGRVSEVNVRVGEKVQKDDVLITLVSPEAASARAELAQAKAQLRAAQSELERQIRIVERGVGVERDKFEAEIRVAEAEAALASAELAVAFVGDETGAFVHVRSPLSGMVLDRSATLGASVEPGGDPMLKIGDPTALWLMVDVFVDDLPLVQEGAKATIDIATVSGTLQGQVASVGAVLRRELRRAPVYIAIDDDELASGSLRNGMYGRALIDSGLLEGVMVPAAAVVIKDGRRHISFVEVSEGEGAFEQREVVVGQVIEDHVQVLSGLNPGDRVVVRGALLLDGTVDLLL